MSKSNKKSARMNAVHFWTLVSRYIKQIVSSIPSLLMMILQAPILLFIVFLIYDKDCFLIGAKAVSAQTTIFVLMFFGSLMGLLGSYREIIKEQDVLSREMSGGLDPVGYVASKLFVQAIIALIQTCMIVLGSMIFINFGFTKPVYDIFMYFITTFLVILSSASMGLLISSIIKKSESAILPVLLIIICQVAFCGLFIEVPPSTAFIGYVSPVKWALVIMGNILDLNSMIPGYTKAVFDERVSTALIMLVVLIIVCYAITVSVIKGKTSYKKMKNK